MGMHSCNYCNYTSDRMYNLKVHIQNKHGNNKNVTYNTGAPGSIPNNGPPTTINAHPMQLGSGNIRTNESGPLQLYNLSLHRSMLTRSSGTNISIY